MRSIIPLIALFLIPAVRAQSTDARYAIEASGALKFGGDLVLARLLPDGEWRYFGAQVRAGRELLRFSFVRTGLREVTIDLSYSEKPSSGAFESSRLSGFLTGFALKEGLSKGKEEKAEITVAGSKTTRIARMLTDKKRTFYFVAYLVARSPHTTIWMLSEDAGRVRQYQSQIEKL
jgi:hypothetical protein